MATRIGHIPVCYHKTLSTMSYLISKLHSKVCTSLLTNSQAIRCRASARSYSRQMKPDPRRNARYPYVKGDPIHEDVIKGRSINIPLSMLKDKDKVMDSKKKDSLKKQTSSFETASGLMYEKIMDSDIRLGRTILEAKSSSKNATDTILLEGQRLILDALLLGAKAKSIYFCSPEILNGIPANLLKDVGLYKILYKDMKTWSDATTPSGILGVFQKPQQGEALSVAETTLPITLIFDSLKDPGNAGTLIRTAAAIGCERVIATKGTVNVWDCKVLRSAMGCHFCVPIFSGLDWADIPNYLDHHTQVFLANTWQSSVLTKSFDKKLRCEDLDKALDEEETSSSDSDSDSDFQQSDHASNLLAEQNAQAFQKVPLAICEYSDIILNRPSSNDNSTSSPGTASIALVLGGETDGLSAQAKKFAYSRYGQYVNIPMNQSVNSLNTGIAGSIILYELRKKLFAFGPKR